MATVLAGWKKRLVLDIGTSAVRLCEISKGKTGYALTRFVQHEFDSDPSLDEAKRKALRTEAVKSVLKQVRAPMRKVVFGVAGQSVFTRTRTLPPVPEYKVTQIVKYEIQQQIPFGLDQIAMDYQILSRNEQGGYEVMMAAIKVDVVDKALEILKPTKRGVAFVDVCPLAAYNWLKHAGDFGTQGECVALVDIGATTTDIVIERGGQFRFTRPLNVGGNDITKAMAAAFNIDFSTAEKLKRERGFAPTGDPQKDGKGGEVIGQALQRLSSEIMRSFSYFRSLPGGGQVNRVVLSGGGARLRNLVPFLQRALGMDVRLVEPLKGLGAISPAAESVKACPEQACVIFGMALRTCVPVPLEIDLIPPRVVEAARRKVQVLYWGVSITALVFSMLSVVPAARNGNRQVKDRIDQLKQAISAYDPEVVQRIRVGTAPPPSGLNDQLTAWKKQLQNVQSQVNSLDKARRWRRFWLDEISLVSEARPATKGMWFSSVETSLFQDEKGAQPAGAPGVPPAPRGGGSGAGTGANAAAGGKQGTASIGFPGIESKLTPGGGARPSPSGGGSSGGGVGSGQSRQNDEPVQANMTLQTGMIIHGLAESDQAIKEFLDELNRASRQLPNGMFLSAEKVVFSEASVQKVSWETLYNAPVDSGIVGGGAGGGSLQPSAQGAQSLFSFTVEVKFRRDKGRVAPNKGQKPEQTAAPAAAAPPAAPPAPPAPPATPNTTGSAAGGNPA